MRTLILTPLLAVLAACASSTSGPSHGPEAALVPATAWTVGDSQGLELLSAVIQKDTRQPLGREEPAALVLRDFLQRTGVDVQLLSLGPGRASVFAEVRGGAPAGAPPILLLSHLDTHPATAEAWPQDAGPHSAAILKDALWGRGVLDGKGLAVLHALILAVLTDAKTKLQRPILMLAAAGGLEAGTPGLTQALQMRPALGNATVVLTKGGGSWINLLGDGRVAHTIANSERGFARVRLTAALREDESANRESAAVRRLNAALSEVLAAIDAPRLTRPTLDTLEFASVGTYFPKSLVMRSTPLARIFMLPDLITRPTTLPLVTDAIEVSYVGTNRSGGQLTPDRAWAILQCRLLPGSTPGGLRSRLRGLIRDPDVHVTVEDGAAWSSSVLSPEVAAAVDAHARIRTERDQVILPIMSPDPSGGRALRELGARVYGLSPYVLQTEDWARTKGRNERLPLEDFRRGLRSLTRIVVQLAQQ